MGPFDVRDLLRLQSIPGLGPLKIHSLLSHFGSPDRVLNARPRELIRVPGIRKKLASAIHRTSIPDSLISDQLSALNRAGGQIIPLWDERYPPLLRRIYDPPFLLFVRGELRANDSSLLAVVGTRHPTPYGENAVRLLVRELVGYGYGIVSGLARGIDTMAHRETLRIEGRTIGVLGSGLDVPYPRENAGLMNDMSDTGAVLSEFAMGTQPDAPHFPRRNRIVSGMTLGTIVVESARDGGAMITASTALDQNREVFAVPGPMFNPSSEGPHALIREGRAKLVQRVEDILEELPGENNRAGSRMEVQPRPELTLFERTILDILGEMPLHVDQIAEKASLAMPDTLVALLGLEFKKLARQLPGKHFIALR